MPRRYEIVGEPEALEVIEDDVYHPDQSQQSSSIIDGGQRSEGQSIHSLQPIITEPIGLKTIFYDPRWTPGQRKLCMFTLLFVSLFLFAVLIALFVGLVRVLKAISIAHDMQKYGLQYQPQFDFDEDEKVIQYTLRNDAQFMQVNKRNYLAINRMITAAKNLSKTSDKSWRRCEQYNAAKNCTFDFETLSDSSCDAENHYGWKRSENASSEHLPCILFVFIKPPGWSLPGNIKNLSVGCEASGPQRRPVDVVQFNTPNEFPVEYLRTPVADIVPPMTFVKISSPSMSLPRNAPIKVVCSIRAKSDKGDTLNLRTSNFHGTVVQVFNLIVH